MRDGEVQVVSGQRRFYHCDYIECTVFSSDTARYEGNRATWSGRAPSLASGNGYEIHMPGMSGCSLSNALVCDARFFNICLEICHSQLHHKEKEDGGIREEAFRRVFEEELALSVDCIKRNPKSYPAWHHHKWALENGLKYLGGR